MDLYLVQNAWKLMEVGCDLLCSQHTGLFSNRQAYYFIVYLLKQTILMCTKNKSTARSLINAGSKWFFCTVFNHVHVHLMVVFTVKDRLCCRYNFFHRFLGCVWTWKKKTSWSTVKAILKRPVFSVHPLFKKAENSSLIYCESYTCSLLSDHFY